MVPTLTFPSQQVGDFTIAAISDGYLTASLDFLSNIDAAEAARMQGDAGQKEPAAVHINCYVVRSAGRTVLIDSGAGGIKQWGGRLKRNLLLASIEPSTIDTILLTHAHPDHVGGLLNAAGETAFANAQLVVHEREVRLAGRRQSGASQRAGARKLPHRAPSVRLLQRHAPYFRRWGSASRYPGDVTTGTHRRAHRLSPRIRRYGSAGLGRRGTFSSHSN